ncbi:MAG: hypothetical protein MUP21_01235 [Dehalococcoidia bacterium]|nr:hypothetical protein [Dehalococcoidia bacterium]
MEFIRAFFNWSATVKKSPEETFKELNDMVDLMSAMEIPNGSVVVNGPKGELVRLVDAFPELANNIAELLCAAHEHLAEEDSRLSDQKGN